MTPVEEQDLREVLDNLWGSLTIEQINELDPRDVCTARHNHWMLHHRDAEPPTKGTA